MAGFSRIGSAEPDMRPLGPQSARGEAIRGEEPGTSCRGKDVEHDPHDTNVGLNCGISRQGEEAFSIQSISKLFTLCRP
jgi:hypothetical protein